MKYNIEGEIMTNKFGLFINLDYAHKSHNECSLIWQEIMNKMLKYGFSFNKRTFSFNTEKSSEEISLDVRCLFDEIQAEHHDFYSYITDCYILNLEGCHDLTLPDTSNSIDVEDISLQDLKAHGVEYDLIFKKTE